MRKPLLLVVLVAFVLSLGVSFATPRPASAHSIMVKGRALCPSQASPCWMVTLRTKDGSWSQTAYPNNVGYFTFYNVPHWSVLQLVATNGVYSCPLSSTLALWG